MSRFSGLLLVDVAAGRVPGRLGPKRCPQRSESRHGQRRLCAGSQLLSASIRTQPSADAYVYLGISYAHTREWMRAEDTLKEGASRYPQDPRFHNELAGVYLAANDLVRARQSLRRTRSQSIRPTSTRRIFWPLSICRWEESSRLSRTWNKDGRPVIGDILHNSHVGIRELDRRKGIGISNRRDTDLG